MQLLHTGEVTLNVKEFNSSAAWEVRPFSFAEWLMKGPLSSNPGSSQGHADLLSPENRVQRLGVGFGIGILSLKPDFETLCLTLGSLPLCLFIFKIKKEKEYLRVALRFSEL